MLLLFTLILAIPDEFGSVITLVEQLSAFAMQPFVLSFKIISLL